MSIEEFIAVQQRKINAIESGHPLEVAARDTHAIMTERLFVDGKNSSNGDIGSYNSDKEIWVNPTANALPKFPTTGKTGKSTFATGKKAGEAHKTGYFDSYKSFREAVGRQTGKVDLVLTGTLQSAFRNGLYAKNASEWVVAVSQLSGDIIDGQEDRFGQIFHLTENEKKEFIETIRYEAGQIMKS